MALNNLTRYALMSGGMRSNNGGMRSESGGNREYGGGMQNQMRGGYANGMRTENRGREGGARSEYRSGYENANRENDPMESRFRDDRGREHYDNGKYAPMRSAYEDDDFSRSGEYYGEMYNDDESRRSWEIIENRSNMGRPMSMHQEERSSENPNVIGFSTAKSSMHRNAASPMNKEMADEWMAGIVNEDGTKGAHWSMSDVKRLMQQRGIEGDPVKVWVAMNAEYSDRQKVNKKYGVDRPDFYLDSALAYWLNDADAVKDKLSTYYTYVVKH